MSGHYCRLSLFTERVPDECRLECFVRMGVCVISGEQVLEIEFCVASVVVHLVCSASRVACLLLVHFSSLFSDLLEFFRFSVFGKGARDFVNFELCFLWIWICLYAGSRSCGSWSSQQHPSREVRTETWSETAIGIGNGNGNWNGNGIGLR